MNGKVGKEVAIAAAAIGVFQIIFGIGISICAGVFGNMYDMLKPFWSAAPCIIAGIVGIIILFTRNQCAFIAYLVMNIIFTIVMAVSATLLGLVHAVLRVAMGFSNCVQVGHICSCFSSGSIKTYHASCSDLTKAFRLVQAMLALTALGAICCFVGAILGCFGLCCKPANQTTVIVASAPPGMVVMNGTVYQQDPSLKTLYGQPNQFAVANNATSPPQQFAIASNANDQPPPYEPPKDDSSS